jgi:hypothetical protein
MPQRLPSAKIVTKDGEIVVHLLIDLNINVNTSGCGVTVSTAKQAGVSTEKDEEETAWEVPTFGPAPKVKFGKTENNEKG